MAQREQEGDRPARRRTGRRAGQSGRQGRLTRARVQWQRRCPAAQSAMALAGEPVAVCEAVCGARHAPPTALRVRAAIARRRRGADGCGRGARCWRRRLTRRALSPPRGVRCVPRRRSKAPAGVALRAARGALVSLVRGRVRPRLGRAGRASSCSTSRSGSSRRAPGLGSGSRVLRRAASALRPRPRVRTRARRARGSPPSHAARARVARVGARGARRRGGLRR